MDKKVSDKKSLKSIFEESLKEISTEGMDQFRRSVYEIFDGRKLQADDNDEKQVKKQANPAEQNNPELED